MVISPSITSHPNVDQWIEFSPEGRVTVHTGKVDIGQRISTALAIIVAEELDVNYDLEVEEIANVSLRAELLSEKNLTENQSSQINSLNSDVSDLLSEKTGLENNIATLNADILLISTEKSNVEAELLSAQQQGSANTEQYASDLEAINLELNSVVSQKQTLTANLSDANSYFLCGPGELIDNVNHFLLDSGIESNKIHFERFTSSTAPKKNIANQENNKEIISNVMVSVDGDNFEFQLSSKEETILDAAMSAGADVPFSCKGGVCCVCKAKVLQGKVNMDQNYSLSEEEVAQGYILTCQSHPSSEDLVIDFDAV